MTEHTHDLNPPAETRRLERSRSDRMVAGVAGGLARYFDIHPAVYRVGFVVLALLGGAGFVIYIAAALVMPNEGDEDSYATTVLKERRDRPWPLIGLGFLAVGMTALLTTSWLPRHHHAWVWLVAVGAVILYLTRNGTFDTVDARAAGERDSRRVRGAAKTVLVVLATLFGIVVLATAAFAYSIHLHPEHGIGTRSYVPTSTEGLQRSYSLAIGDLKLDLNHLELPKGKTVVSARVDVGDLDITVPSYAALRLLGTAQYGKVEVLANTSSGHHATEVVGTGTGLSATRVLVVNGHVGAGHVHIHYANAG
jgi:phage shock protein PspC (stress-responsive transcriptional regulator)